MPANEFINAQQTGNEGRLKDITAIWDERPLKRALLNHGWYPHQVGVVVDHLPMQKQDGKLYNQNSGFSMIDLPLWEPSRHTFENINVDPLQTDLKRNLQYFRAKYLAAKYRLKPLSSYQKDSRWDSEEFARLHAIWSNYLDNQLAMIENALSLIDSR